MYYAGKALPGGEQRSKELDYAQLNALLNANIFPGTFNVSLITPISLGHPFKRSSKYGLWPCRVSTESMIARDQPGIQGWVIKVWREKLPTNFVEIISEIHIRERLKKTNWPAFSIEIMLESSKESAKLGQKPFRRVRNHSGGTDST